MNHTLAIAGRELAEKRFVFVAAAAFALIAALMPLVPGIHGSGAEAVVIAGIILATGFALGLAAILGSTIVGRDIAAGRMSFYFARPIGGAAIWFGKLAASLVLVVVSFFIAVLPALLAGPMTVRRVWSGSVWQVAAIVAATALVLFFGAHALGTMIRSRSAIIALDFVAAAVAVAIAQQIARPLAIARTEQALLFLGESYAAALLVAAVGAGAWQLIDGRSDRKRSHRAFSTFFWSALAVALLLAAIFVGWMVSVKPSELRGRLFVLQPPQGDAAILSGDAPHRFDYRPTFLGDRRIDGTAWACFSADGQHALTLQSSSFLAPVTEIVVRDAADGWRAKPTKLAFHGWMRFAATDDLARFAAGDDRLVTVYDVAASRSLGSFRTEMPMRTMFFVTPSTLRVYATDGPRMAVFEYDVAARALHKVGEATLRDTPVMPPRFSPDGTRMLLMEHHVGRALRDARTLQMIEPAKGNAVFLHDGRIVNFDGRFGGEIAPGKVLRPTETATDLVDVDSGKVIAHGEGLTPVPSVGVFWSGVWRAGLVNPNGFYEKKDGSIVRWNPLKTAAAP